MPLPLPGPPSTKITWSLAFPAVMPALLMSISCTPRSSSSQPQPAHQQASGVLQQNAGCIHASVLLQERPKPTDISHQKTIVIIAVRTYCLRTDSSSSEVQCSSTEPGCQSGPGERTSEKPTAVWGAATAGEQEASTGVATVTRLAAAKL